MKIFRHNAAVFFCVMVLAFILLLVSMPRIYNIFDEGIILVDAMRMLNGAVVHRDFYSSYGPAQYAALAVLFTVFGVSAMVAKVYGLLIFAAIVATVFHILRSRVPFAFAAASAVLVTMWLFVEDQPLYPVFPCALLALWGSALVLAAHNSERAAWRLFAAGLCTGLATLFRYDAGFFLMLAHLAALVAVEVIPATRAGSVSFRRMAVRGALYVVGIGLVFLPVAAAFLAVSPVQSFTADIVDYSRKYYLDMRGLPFPHWPALKANPWESMVYLPIVTAALTMLAVMRRVRIAGRIAAPATLNTTLPAQDLAFLIVFGLVGFTFFFKGVVRVSALHMMMSNILNLPVLAMLVARWWQSAGARRAVAVLAGLAIAAPAVQASFAQLVLSRADISRPLGGWALAQMGIHAFEKTAPFGCGPLLNAMALRVPVQYLRVARYLDAQSTPNERIFVGTSRHDRIFVNSVSLYYFARRLPATHWHQFDPGLQTRADIQARMVNELDRQATRWLVLDNSFDAIREPNGSARSSGVTVLDDYIKTHYHQVAAAGEVAVWLVNGAHPVAATTAVCMAAPAPTTPG